MSIDERTSVEPWPEPVIPDLDIDGRMHPPWVKFPNLPRRSAGWRMGMGESYLRAFQAWWSRQPRPVRLSVRTRYPEPEEWAGFWQSQAGA